MLVAFPPSLRAILKAGNRFLRAAFDYMLIFESYFKAGDRFLRAIDKSVNEKAPAPFTTSTLQQTSYSSLHLPIKMTMSLAQDLYEMGAITYMRTDSKVYSEEFVNKVEDYIIRNYNDEFINKNINNLNMRYVINLYIEKNKHQSWNDITKNYYVTLGCEVNKDISKKINQFSCIAF